MPQCCLLLINFHFSPTRTYIRKFSIASNSKHTLCVNVIILHPRDKTRMKNLKFQREKQNYYFADDPLRFADPHFIWHINLMLLLLTIPMPVTGRDNRTGRNRMCLFKQFPINTPETAWKISERAPLFVRYGEKNLIFIPSNCFQSETGRDLENRKLQDVMSFRISNSGNVLWIRLEIWEGSVRVRWRFVNLAFFSGRSFDRPEIERLRSVIDRFRNWFFVRSRYRTSQKQIWFISDLYNVCGCCRVRSKFIQNGRYNI